ncbi:hypothetical protein DQT32_04895 [Salmonella enterica subsp. enterica serovar Braenderup]|nr:hypothetical protein [Salmonella enterica subsp. enterica serovar Braenderup]
MSINIEKEFYIPETFDVQRRWKRDYNYEKRDYDVLDEYDDEFFLRYVNQKGSTVYYLSEERIAKSDTYQNIPMTGFTIDRNTYSYADYRSVVDGVIIKDPRGFEFKISIRNFLHLTRHHVIDHGEIKAECILTWSVSGYLTLLSTESDSYKSAVEYTAKQHAVFDPENLEIGKSYTIKKSTDVFVYLGKHKFNTKADTYYLPFNLKPSKQLRPVFYNQDTDEFVTFMLGKNLAGEVDVEAQDISELVKRFKNTPEGRTFKEFTFTDVTKNDIMYNDRGLMDGILGQLHNDNFIYASYFSEGIWYKGKDDSINISLEVFNLKDGRDRDTYKFNNELNIPRNVHKDKFIKAIDNSGFKIVTVHFEDELSEPITLAKEYV